MAIYSFKYSIQNCGQTAADEHMVTIDSLQEVVRVLSDGAIADPYDLPFNHNTARLALHSALWLFKVIQGQWFSSNLTRRMRLFISD